jgi:hypothetical protein
MFWVSRVVSQAFTDKLHVFAVVLDTIGDNKALAGSNVIHDKLLQATGIEVSDVVTSTVAWHTEGVETIGSSE